MFQPGFFDLDKRMRKIDSNGDPLTKRDQIVDWDKFRPALEKAREKPRKSAAGPKGYDVILLLKSWSFSFCTTCLMNATEYQILDRHSFGRFLGLHIGSKVPDATTIWRFREDLINAGVIEEQFAQFEIHLQECGYMALKGQIVDASVHDSNVFEEILADSTTNRKVGADSAYYSKDRLDSLEQSGYT